MVDGQAAEAEWMTMNQASEYLDVSISTVKRYFDARKLNGFRTKGGVRRVYRDATAATVRESVRQARAEAAD